MALIDFHLDQGSAKGRHPSQIALAVFAGTDVKMTSQVVRSLERKGFLERHVDASDTRARRLRPTRRGARLAPRAISVVQQGCRNAFGVSSIGALRRRLGVTPLSRAGFRARG